jgi:sarcosine oxidase gamma subunit
MRDLAKKWSPVPDWQSAVIERPRLKIRTLTGFSQALVSGNLAAWREASGLSDPPAGALSVVTGTRYAACIARDRILAVSETPFDIASGWHESGFALSAINAGLHMLEIEGPELADLWAQATTLDPHGVTSSASVLFAGAHVLCYRHGHGERLRIHIDRGLAPYLWTWLERALAVGER